MKEYVGIPTERAVSVFRGETLRIYLPNNRVLVIRASKDSDAVSWTLEDPHGKEERFYL